ncbi:hypothetical protein SAMN05192558_10756 [Actinokineospora alba]|uniref:Uncharacterized protein n=1 Tax=Actinokineospora alba TaxID=504798 RepID=A0A1H0QM59_9PSEU|nr:hypothetical protein [Actinokineospora alba]TDP70482.1 hypothetical protein C8E96_6096 [Actinokineospora alba]SDI30528.1 hypothetical protein SAMN05421871_10455 [Actinokineospora alba]SDP18481.1 hypothetical protein SAMN05192558_10756 [Actinokineospora alba]
MPERDSGWLSGSVVDAEDARLATGALALAAKGPLQSRSGLRPAPGDPGLVRPTATPSASITVQPFQAVIQGTRNPAAGSYLATLDQVKTVDVLTAAPAHASYPRYDLVVARQSDAQYGDSRSAFTVEVVTGTPTASPADPAVTGDVVRLARLKVRAGATMIAAADIVDLRPYTCAVGGILPVRNASERPVDPYPGFYVHRIDTGKVEFWNGTGWRSLVVEDDTGWVEVPLLADWSAVGLEPVNDGTAIRVRRIGQIVHLSGSVTRKNTTAAHGTAILTLPQAYRPTWAHRWVATTYYGHQKSAPQFYELGLYPSGSLVLWTDNAQQVPIDEQVFLNTSYLLG